ncbi:cyclopropane-fatty-acyl-phospholipid synthase family protein [Ideonella sp. DXS29W]|uniref:Cyclopropane-fatty-acyl-phospholipid synthase family protein n=1 Tax=Ideonella lacteola TaxID=2984193 RepID=A0ABU9BNJ4_9BURK
MNTDTLVRPGALARLPASAPAAARTALRLLQRLSIGTLHLQDPDGRMLVFGGGSGPHASMRLHDWSVCTATLRSGDVGFGEAYIDGGWSTPDLAALLRLFLANREVIDQAIYGRWWGALWHRVRHALNRNSRAGSRRNIAAHYDLGNPFYRLWLDETMNYSSAWFAGDSARALPDAQRAKMRRALDECGLEAGQRVLEIGCGWGAVAELASGERGLNLTGVTLSTEQLAHARERLARQELSADLRLQDYRDIPETSFDAVVSIEMFEAVGREYWDQYFRCVHDKLKPGGKACIQSITIRDDLFERYVRGTDFIQQYIFPGGLLPSPSAFRAAARDAGLEVVNELDFGTDYATTLRHWRRAFLAQESQVRAQGFDDRFVRLWEFYLAYCEAAFDAGNTSVIQFTLRRP